MWNRREMVSGSNAGRAHEGQFSFKCCRQGVAGIEGENEREYEAKGADSY